MNDHRFDAAARLLADVRSRRAALRTLLGAALGAALAVPQVVPAGAATCSANGAKCDPATPTDCCTGTCKKHKGKFKCAPAGSAQGCAKQLDVCRVGAPAPCPANPGGPVCIEGKKGKPLCVSNARCAACTCDADCTTNFGPTARCIKGCTTCQQVGLSTACAVPAPSI
jgi:hypothetical protein